MDAHKEKPFGLRLPEEWKVALKVAAARNHRSLGAEILFRLRPTVEADLAAEAEAERGKP